MRKATGFFNALRAKSALSLPTPVNMGIGNEMRRNVRDLDARTSGEFISQLELAAMGAHSAIVCSMDLQGCMPLLRQLLGRLGDMPRVLICPENRLGELGGLHALFPAGNRDISAGPIPNGIATLPAGMPVEALKNMLYTNRSVYTVLYLRGLSLDTAVLNLLNSMPVGHMLLLNCDPTNVLEDSQNINRLFSRDWIFADSYPGASAQAVSGLLPTYRKNVTQHMSNLYNTAQDFHSISQLNTHDEVPVFTKAELYQLSDQHKALAVDRIHQACYTCRSEVFSGPGAPAGPKSRFGRKSVF